jgi:hypothetical protein
MNQKEMLMKHGFLQDGYAYVENAYDERLCSVATIYALLDRRRREADNTAYADSQVPNTFAQYGDPLMESLLLHNQEIVEGVTGLSLLPTYSYYRVYKSGDELHRHKDRPACEISSTVFLGANYKGWPIYMGETPVQMQVGSLVVYRGMDIEHWRPKWDAPPDAWHVQVFLHYVNANGQHANEKFDGRPMIGIPKQQQGV